MNFHMLYAWHRAPHNALARAIPVLLDAVGRLDPSPPIRAQFVHRDCEDPVSYSTTPDATQRFETNHACLFRAGPDPDRPEVEFILTPVPTAPPTASRASLKEDDRLVRPHPIRRSSPATRDTS